MAQQSFSTKIITILVFSAFFLLNVGGLRCESRPGELSNAQYQAKIDSQRQAKSVDDQEVREEKSQRFKELEWLIQQNLLQKYQKLEVGDPEELLD